MLKFPFSAAKCIGVFPDSRAVSTRDAFVISIYCVIDARSRLTAQWRGVNPSTFLLALKSHPLFTSSMAVVSNPISIAKCNTFWPLSTYVLIYILGCWINRSAISSNPFCIAMYSGNIPLGNLQFIFAFYWIRFCT